MHNELLQFYATPKYENLKSWKHTNFDSNSNLNATCKSCPRYQRRRNQAFDIWDKLARMIRYPSLHHYSVASHISQHLTENAFVIHTINFIQYFCFYTFMRKLISENHECEARGSSVSKERPKKGCTKSGHVVRIRTMRPLSNASSHGAESWLTKRSRTGLFVLTKIKNNKINCFVSIWLTSYRPGEIGCLQWNAIPVWCEQQSSIKIPRTNCSSGVSRDSVMSSSDSSIISICSPRRSNSLAIWPREYELKNATLAFLLMPLLHTT